MNEIFSVEGKVVVITGGTGVLGSCISEYLAAQGAKVVLLGRRRDEGEKIETAIRDKGHEALFLETDVLDVARLEQNREEILSRYGRIDALLNAAGGNMPGATIPPGKTFFDVDIAAFEKVLGVNLTGTVLRDTGVPEADGRGWSWRRSQFLIDGSLPPPDTRHGIRSGEGRHQQFHAVYGQ